MGAERTQLTLAVMFLWLGIGCHHVQAHSLDHVEPMRTWAHWVEWLGLPQKVEIRDLRRPSQMLTQDEWAVERIYIVVDRLTGSCRDLEFKNAPFLIEYFDQVGFAPGLVVSNTDHAQHLLARDLLSSVDAAHSIHGDELCRWTYRSFGPGGHLASAMAQLWSPSTYSRQGQVIWRSRDICRRPKQFWDDPRVDSASIERACKEADKHSGYWGD